MYDGHQSDCNNEPLEFRTSSVMARDKISLNNAIVLNRKINNYSIVHTELTSRSLVDGEIFKLVGNTKEVGVGVCVESCFLEKKV